jgi:hypothetical protein
MNHPHYVIDWDSLDDAIDHCDRFYGSNALAPIVNDPSDPYEWDERPTGFDFIEYHRAENRYRGDYLLDLPEVRKICPREFNAACLYAVNDSFDIDDQGNEWTSIKDQFGRFYIQLRTPDTGYSFFRIDGRLPSLLGEHDRRAEAINAFELMIGMDGV